MKKLYLSKNDRKVFGVCGGIGETYDIDPTVVRLAVILLCVSTIVTFPAILAYVIAWIIMPEKPKSLEKPEDPEKPSE